MKKTYKEKLLKKQKAYTYGQFGVLGLEAGSIATIIAGMAYYASTASPTQTAIPFFIPNKCEISYIRYKIVLL